MTDEHLAALEQAALWRGRYEAAIEHIRRISPRTPVVVDVPGSSITVIVCTECQKDACVHSWQGAINLPLGWWLIDEVGDIGGVFCSTGCVNKFREQYP